MSAREPGPVLRETGCTCGAVATLRRPHTTSCAQVERLYAERYGVAPSAGSVG